jgi:glutathione-specific gamma-glutamylcyclotransferase
VAWVFAYGSLMGDAVLARYRVRPARLPAYRRAFLHESTRRWGTPEHPCPILGLAPGGECWGLAFEIPDEDRRTVERALAKREAARERRPATLSFETGDGALLASVWLSRHANGGGTDLDGLDARLRAAHGVVGTGVEYVRTLVHALEPHGIRDPLVDALWARLRS